MTAIGLLFGALVGISLGLTGGGGAIFAVPLLVYGLGVDPREAIGVSLVTVGAAALVGGVQRLRAGQVELPTGLMFAGAGMVGAPAGSWLAGRIPEAVLLTLFAGLMLVIAVRMGWNARDAQPDTEHCSTSEPAGPACRRDPVGKLQLTSRCVALLAVVGLATGVLSGLFGVGGGFIIVPALVTFSGMDIRRAVGTSLLVISLVSVAAIGSHLAAGRAVPPEVTSVFLAGALGGLGVGTWTSRRLSGPRLQQVFAVAILAVAGMVLVKNMF